jgi:hypothetical protein
MPTPRWRKARPQRAAAFERVLSLLIVPWFGSLWMRDGKRVRMIATTGSLGAESR